MEQRRKMGWGLILLHITVQWLATVDFSRATTVQFFETDKAGFEGEVVDVVFTMDINSQCTQNFIIHLQASTEMVSTDPAEDADHTFNITNIIVTPNLTSVEPVTFKLVDDMIWENDEEFYIILSIMNNSTYCGSLGMQSSIRIRIVADSSDQVTLSLSSIFDGGSNLAVDESAGNVSNFVILNRTGESEVDIDLVFEDILLVDDDIVIHLPGVLRRDEYNLSIPLTVIDDAVTEANETFLIQLHDGQYFVDDNYSSVTVTVVDDDSIEVGFLNDSSVVIEESNTAILCIGIVDGFFDEPFTVAATRQGGNATVDDYKLGPMGSTSVIGSELVSGSEEVKCFTFETIDNDKPEWMRSVQLELHSLNDLVTVGQKAVLVQIVDNDGTPLRPEIHKATINDKSLDIDWSSEVTALRPIIDFGVHVVSSSKIDNKPKRQSLLDQNGRVFFTNETSYSINDINTDKTYTITVCSRNRLGMNCSAPVSVSSDNPTSNPTPVRNLDDGRLSPNLIIIIIVMCVIILLLCCLLLCCLLCCCCSRERGKHYFPEKRERKYAEDYTKYRKTDSDLESDESDYNV